MNINQPPANWIIYAESHDKTSKIFMKNDLFCDVENTLISQLQSEAYQKGRKDEFFYSAKIAEERIEEARADERKKRESKDRNVYARAYDLAKKSYGDAYNFLMDYIDTDKQKELEQPVEVFKKDEITNAIKNAKKGDIIKFNEVAERK